MTLEKGFSMILNYVRHKSVRRPWIERYTDDGDRVQNDFDAEKADPAGNDSNATNGEYNEKKALEAGEKNPAFAPDTTEF